MLLLSPPENNGKRMKNVSKADTSQTLFAFSPYYPIDFYCRVLTDVVATALSFGLVHMFDCLIQPIIICI